MPVYEFYHLESGTIVDVYIPITGDVKSYNGEDGTQSGQWKRHFGASSVNISAGIRVKDAFSQSAFHNATQGKNMSFGDALDLSAELSEKRAAKNGIDPVKQKFYDDYERENKVKHLDVIAAEKKAKMQEAVKNNPIFKIED